MRKERFPAQRRSKMLPRGDGPFQVLDRINDNAYNLDLSGEYNVSATFNVSDLSPFDADSDLRTNPFQEGGSDADIKEEQTNGPITRARAKRMKKDMNNLVLQVVQEVESKHTQGNKGKLIHIIQAVID